MCPSCLRDYISQGLQLKVRLCVPKSPCRKPVSHLHKDWAHIIKRASRDFLSALKIYHRSCAYHLRLQATNLEASIETHFGRANVRALEHKSEAIYAKWSQWLQHRHVKKLNKLHLLAPNRRQTHCQRHKRACRRFKRNTPINENG